MRTEVGEGTSLLSLQFPLPSKAKDSVVPSASSFLIYSPRRYPPMSERRLVAFETSIDLSLVSTTLDFGSRVGEVAENPKRYSPRSERRLDAFEVSIDLSLVSITVRDLGSRVGEVAEDPRRYSPRSDSRLDAFEISIDLSRVSTVGDLGA